jgi:hypothetical protein
LFSILIPFLLSVAVFEKLGILELNLPERSEVPPDQPRTDVDDQNLNLTVIITPDYLTAGASGGFMPSFYYQEEVEYRSKSDGNTFREVFEEGKVVKSPTDGKEMTIFEKSKIFLHYLAKKDSADPGEFQLVAMNHLDEPIVDSSGEFLAQIPPAGAQYQIIGEPTLRVMKANERHLFKVGKLSAYDALARDLWKLQLAASKREEVPTDIDRLTILASPKIIYDKIIHVMDAAKYAGFSQLSLSLLGG